MNRVILNNLPFPRTTRYLLSISTKEMYHLIKVKLIKTLIEGYVFDKGNKYHVDKVIGHMHRTLNKDFHDIGWGNMNFLLLSIRNDLEDDYDAINSKADERKDLEIKDDNDSDNEIVKDIDKIMINIKNQDYSDDFGNNLNKITSNLKKLKRENNSDFHGRY